VAIVFPLLPRKAGSGHAAARFMPTAALRAHYLSAEKTTNPKRDTPIALLTALGVVCVIYTAVQFAVVAILPDAGASTAALAMPRSDFWDRGRNRDRAGRASFRVRLFERESFACPAHYICHLPSRVISPRFWARFIPDTGRRTFPSSSMRFWFLWFAGTGELRVERHSIGCLAPDSLPARWPGSATAAPAQRSPGALRSPLALPLRRARLIFSLLLLTQMGKGEFVIVGTTCVVAFVNWLVVRR